MRPILGHRLRTLVVALMLILAGPAPAQNTWTNSAGGSWNDSTAWTPSSVPNGAGASATFGAAATGSVNVTLASDVVIGTITFDSISATGAYNIGTAGRTITMVSATGIAGAQIVANSNSLGLVNPQRFVAGQTLQVADLGGLTVTNNGLTLLEFSGPVTLLNSGVLAVGGTGSRGVQFDAGTLSGTGGLTKSGVTILSITGAQPGLSGVTSVTGGTVAIDNATSLGADPAGVVANQLTLNGGALRDVTTNALTLGINRGARMGAAGGTIDVSNSTGTFQLNGAISGSGSLTKTGPGTLILNGANGTYAGAVAVNGGALQLASLSALGNANASTISVASGAQLQITGGINTYTSYPLTLNGTGPGGTGAFVSLSGINTWNGLVTLAGDALINTSANTAWLTMQGGVNLNGHQLSLGNASTSGSFSTLTVANSGFSGTGSLILDTGNTGSVTLSAASTSFVGPTTILSNATVSLENSLALGSGDGTANTGITVAANSVLELVNSTTVNPVNIGNKPLTLGGSPIFSSSLEGEGRNNSYAGPISLTNSSTISVTNIGTGGLLTLSGGVSAGTTVLTLNSAVGATLLVTTNGISGNAGLNVTGTGTAQLAVASTYSGTTTVSGGRLLATNSTGSATGSSTITIASGGALAGGNGGSSANPFADSTVGFVSGAITVQSGGAVAPGNNSAGVLTASGGVTFQTGSIFAVDLASHVLQLGATPVDVNTNSRLHSGANLAFGNSLTVDIDGGGQTFPFVNTYDYYIALADGSVGILPATITFVPTDFASSVKPGDFALNRSTDGHELILTYTAVPEPGTFALVVAAAMAGWRLRRRV